MYAEEEIPESVRTTLDAMRGKENAYGLQNRLVTFMIVALVSGLMALELLGNYIYRDPITAGMKVLLLMSAWGLCLFIFACFLFRKRGSRSSGNQLK